MFSLQFLHGYIIYMYICICTYTNIDFKFKFSTPLDKIINFFFCLKYVGVGGTTFFLLMFFLSAKGLQAQEHLAAISLVLLHQIKTINFFFNPGLKMV